MYYSAKNNNFYGEDIGGCVFIPDDEAFQLFTKKQTGYTTIPDEAGYPKLIPMNRDLPLLEELKRYKIEEVECAWKKETFGNVQYLGTEFQADEKSQLLITQVITASGGNLPQGFVWFDVNNSPVAMSYSDLQGLAGAILSRGQALFMNKQLVKSSIREADTPEKVNAITW